MNRKVLEGAVEPGRGPGELEDAMHVSGLGSRIQALREREGMTPQELAKLLQMSNTSIWRVEHGHHELKLDSLRQLREATGVDLNWLILGDKAPEGPAPMYSGDAGGALEVPLMAWDGERFYPVEPPETVTVPSRLAGAHGQDFAFLAPDDSMEPVIRRGWLLGVCPEVAGVPPESMSGKIVLALLGGRAVPRWFEATRGVWAFSAEANGYEPATLARTEAPPLLGLVSWWRAVQEVPGHEAQAPTRSSL